MKLIPLTQGLSAMVDDEDFEWLSQFKWCATRDRRVFYAVRNLPRAPGAARGKPQRMHTAITGFAETDHIDGDGLNNQRANLREASRHLNNRNRRKQLGASAPFKGVYLDRRDGRYGACIWAHGRNKNLGRYPTAEAAARVYDDAARALWGSDATFNFPLPGERSALTGDIRMGEHA